MLSAPCPAAWKMALEPASNNCLIATPANRGSEAQPFLGVTSHCILVKPLCESEGDASLAKYPIQYPSAARSFSSGLFIGTDTIALLSSPSLLLSSPLFSSPLFSSNGTSLRQDPEPLRSDDQVPIHVPSIQERAEQLASQFKGKPAKPKVTHLYHPGFSAHWFMPILDLSCFIRCD